MRPSSRWLCGEPDRAHRVRAGSTGNAAQPEGELRGAVLDTPYVVPPAPLTDTTGAAYSLTRDTDKPLTLVFFGYTRCPDICQVVLVLGRLGADLPRRGGPRAGRRRVRHDGPGPGHPSGAARLPRQLRPEVRRLTGDHAIGRSASAGRGRRGGREAPQRRLRRGAQHPRERDQRRRRGLHRVDPGHPRPTSPPTSTSCCRSEVRVSMLTSLSIPSERRDLVPRARADPRLRPLDHPRHHRRDLAGRTPLGGAAGSRGDRRPRGVGDPVRADRW